MKERESLLEGEKLLAQALDECLEEDLSFIPPERELARKHHFSEEFEKTIEELLKDASDASRKRIQKHFFPRYGQWAACLLIFCICSGLFYYITRPLPDQTESVQEGGASGSADTGFDELQEEAVPEFYEEPASDREGEAAKEDSASGYAKEADSVQEADLETVPGKKYCGQTVYPAEQQEVPEVLDYATTLVNCPVLDEENPILILTIGNTGEEELRYLNHYMLEVRLDDKWYVIPERLDAPEEWMTLEAGMAVDEEIDLTDYHIDYDAQQYRLITRVNQELVSAEFTFGDGFTETMDLEENSLEE